MDDRIVVLREMLALAEAFLDERIEYPSFIEGTAALLGTEFDPLDERTEDLPPEAARLAHFFSEWTGGEFGEHESRIPRRADWHYGDQAPYGWVDVPAYRVALRNALEAVRDLARTIS